MKSYTLITLLLISTSNLSALAAPNTKLFTRNTRPSLCSHILENLGLTQSPTKKFEKLGRLTDDSTTSRLQKYIGSDIELWILDSKPDFIPGTKLGYRAGSFVVKNDNLGYLRPVYSGDRLEGIEELFVSSDGSESITAYVGTRESSQVTGRLLTVETKTYSGSRPGRLRTEIHLIIETTAGNEHVVLTSNRTPQQILIGVANNGSPVI